MVAVCLVAELLSYLLHNRDDKGWRDTSAGYKAVLKQGNATTSVSAASVTEVLM